MISLTYTSRTWWGWLCTCGACTTGFDTTTRAIDSSLYHAEDCKEVLK